MRSFVTTPARGIIPWLILLQNHGRGEHTCPQSSTWPQRIVPALPRAIPGRWQIELVVRRLVLGKLGFIRAAVRFWDKGRPHRSSTDPRSDFCLSMHRAGTVKSGLHRARGPKRLIQTDNSCDLPQRPQEPMPIQQNSVLCDLQRYFN